MGVITQIAEKKQKKVLKNRALKLGYLRNNMVRLIPRQFGYNYLNSVPTSLEHNNIVLFTFLQMQKVAILN